MWVSSVQAWREVEKASNRRVRKMSETSDLIPRPRSLFLRVKCKNCGAERVVFDRSSTEVKCEVCDETLIIPTGGRANVKGEILQILG